MSEQPVHVNKISWQALCPWTIIFKSLSAATSMPVLILALLGLVAMPMGWIVAETIFVDQGLAADQRMAEVIQYNRNPHKRVFLATDDEANSINILGARLSGPRMVFTQIVEPFAHLFSIPQYHVVTAGGTETTSRWSFRAFLYLLTGCVSSLLIWSFIGVAICRVALLKMTRNEPMSLDEAFEFALEKSTAAIGAVGIPLLGVAAMCVPAFFFGLFMGFDLGVLLVGLLWFVVLALAAAMAILLAGLMFGWPLMVASVACEAQNNFDAMTRAYAYTFQRPLNYAMYLLIAMVFGGFCWLVIANLTEGILNLGYWSTSFGTTLVSGDDSRMDVVRSLTAPTTVDEEGKVIAADPSTPLYAGQALIRGWSWLARSVAAAFIYGLFWCMASAIYLLLRKDVDDTEMDVITVVNQQRTYELPPLKTDENGIPQIQTPTPKKEDPEEEEEEEEEEVDEELEEKPKKKADAKSKKKTKKKMKKKAEDKPKKKTKKKS